MQPASDLECSTLLSQLAALAPLTAAERSLLPRPSRVTLPAGREFLRAGQCATHTALVMEGGLREYYLLADGTERTKSFNLPGELAGSLADLLADAPSRTWVVAEVPTVLLVTAWPDYVALQAQSFGWQRLACRVAEQLYLRKVEREYELLSLDAEARYRRALARWPTLEAVFLQRHIASYLGVTPVHLSRLRAARR